MNAHRHVYDGIITTTKFLRFYRWHLCIFSLDQGSVYWAVLTNRIWQHDAETVSRPRSYRVATPSSPLEHSQVAPMGNSASMLWDGKVNSQLESVVPRQLSITPIGHVYQPSWTFNLAEPSTYDYNNTKDCKQELPSWAQSTQRVMRDIHKLF